MIQNNNIQKKYFCEMFLVIKKILFSATIALLVLLLSDACPDFSDNYIGKRKDHVETSNIEKIAHFVLIEILNFKHNSDAHTCDENCNHTFEVDFFIPSEQFALQPFRFVLHQLTLDHYYSLEKIPIDVIPLPPNTIS